MTDPTPRQLIAWQALLGAHDRGLRQVETALRAAGLPSMDVHDALHEIAEAREITAVALETRLAMPQYAISRLIERMERKGLVARIANPSDRRVKFIRLTATGQKTRRAMWAIYGAAIADFLGTRAKPGQIDRLTDLLALLDRDTGDRAPVTPRDRASSS